MNREKVRIIDLAVNSRYPNDKNLCIDDWDTCGEVTREQTDYDAEKGFVTYRIVLERYSDGKFFEVEYTQFAHNGNDLLEQVASEVFESIVEVKIYR